MKLAGFRAALLVSERIGENGPARERERENVRTSLFSFWNYYGCNGMIHIFGPFPATTRERRSDVRKRRHTVIFFYCAKRSSGLL